jgi:hypothetical protein
VSDGFDFWFRPQPLPGWLSWISSLEQRLRDLRRGKRRIKAWVIALAGNREGKTLNRPLPMCLPRDFIRGHAFLCEFFRDHVPNTKDVIEVRELVGEAARHQPVQKGLAPPLWVEAVPFAKGDWAKEWERPLKPMMAVLEELDRYEIYHLTIAIREYLFNKAEGTAQKVVAFRRSRHREKDIHIWLEYKRTEHIRSRIITRVSPVAHCRGS